MLVISAEESKMGILSLIPGIKKGSVRVTHGSSKLVRYSDLQVHNGYPLILDFGISGLFYTKKMIFCYLSLWVLMVVLSRPVYHLHTPWPDQHQAELLGHRNSFATFSPFCSDSDEVGGGADFTLTVFAFGTSVSLPEKMFSCLASVHNQRNWMK